MSDEHTPPRGGASYTMVDVGELAKRAADRAIEARDIALRVEKKLESFGDLAAKIDLLARPVARPRYVNIAVVAIAVCALVMATASVVRTQAILEAKTALTLPER
jgi:hypothetical protein